LFYWGRGARCVALDGLNGPFQLENVLLTWPFSWIFSLTNLRSSRCGASCPYPRLGSFTATCRVCARPFNAALRVHAFPSVGAPQMPKQYRHRKVSANTTAFPMDRKVRSTCDIGRRIGKCFFLLSVHRNLPDAPPSRVPPSPQTRVRLAWSTRTDGGLPASSPVAPSVLDKPSPHAHQHAPFLFLFFTDQPLTAPLSPAVPLTAALFSRHQPPLFDPRGVRRH
jgi:hypothetical protein